MAPLEVAPLEVLLLKVGRRQLHVAPGLREDKPQDVAQRPQEEHQPRAVAQDGADAEAVKQDRPSLPSTPPRPHPCRGKVRMVQRRTAFHLACLGL